MRRKLWRIGCHERVIMDASPRTTSSPLLAAICISVLAAAAGCSYSSYPRIEGNRVARQDVNFGPNEKVVIQALQYVLKKHPAPGGGEVALNLPVGLRRSACLRIVAAVGNGAVPLTEDAAATLPIYHVPRIWLRNHKAYVDILRPVYALGRGADGDFPYRGVTVRFDGAFNNWKIIGGREWEVGTVDVPELWYLPETEQPTQPVFEDAPAAETEFMYEPEPVVVPPPPGEAPTLEGSTNVIE
jgi:hypothetical protein